MFPEDKLVFQRIARRPAIPKGYEFVSSSISTDGRCIFVCVQAHLVSKVVEKVTGAGGAIFPKTAMETEGEFLLIVVGENQQWEIKIPPLNFTFPICDLFPDGRVLLAGARSEWRGPEDFDKNGFIFDPETGSLERILLGDGIAELGIDAQNRIWVSYFDEGVFGNLGWGRKGPKGPGRGGLVCFNDTGEQLWAFNGTKPDHLIDSCYALNMQRDQVWAYYYSDFNILQVDGQFETTILTDPAISGAHSFAVHDDHFLFSKQYRESEDTFHVLKHVKGQVSQTRALKGILPDGETFDGCTVVGRGSCIHVVTAAGWFAVDLVEY